eukprot:1141580-Pelagomonas_calceolata.AAC.6
MSLAAPPWNGPRLMCTVSDLGFICTVPCSSNLEQIELCALSLSDLGIVCTVPRSTKLERDVHTTQLFDGGCQRSAC